MANPNRTILIKGELQEYHDEARAAEATKPGRLLQKIAAGTVQNNQLVAGNVPIYVAMEDVYIGHTVDDTYATGDLVQFHVAQKGDWLMLRLPAAAAAIAKGDRLEFVAGGLVQKLASGVAAFIAEGAVDNSSGAADVEILASVI